MILLSNDSNSKKEEALKVIKTHIKVSSIFSEFGLYNDSLVRGDEVMITCPFHLDDYPSLSINDNRGMWHCFSCGKGGNVVTAYTSLYFHTRKVSMSTDDAINQLILNNSVVKTLLPFTSIKSIDKPKLDIEFKARKFNSVSVDVTVNDIYLYMLNNNLVEFTNIAQINELLMSGMSPYNILEFLKNQNKISTTGNTQNNSDKLSLEELLSSVEW